METNNMLTLNTGISPFNIHFEIFCEPVGYLLGKTTGFMKTVCFSRVANDPSAGAQTARGRVNWKV